MQSIISYQIQNNIYNNNNHPNQSIQLPSTKNHNQQNTIINIKQQKSSSLPKSQKYNQNPNQFNQYFSPSKTQLPPNRASPSILPSYTKNQQRNQLIEQYLLYNLSDPQTKTLKSGVVSIQFLTDSIYIGQISNNPPNNQLPPNSSNYSCKQGKGIYQYSNNDIYMGDWHDDNFNGLGMYIFTNGDVYRGLFKNGSNIKGKFISANGDQYTGEFRDGYKHGYGTMKYKVNQYRLIRSNSEDKDKEFECEYSGQWQRGKRHGKGIYKQKQYTITGLWQDDEINGQVVIKGENFQYTGIMSNGQLIKGEIKIKYDERCKYEGQVYKNKYEGNGRFENGLMVYCGEFKEGKVEGRGRYQIQNKQLNGSLGIMYEGEINSKGLPNGKGKMLYVNHDLYEGEWKNGIKQGYGYYQYSNGDKYDGGFHCDQIEGNGKYTWKNGQIAIGQFKCGVLIKQNSRVRTDIQRNGSPSQNIPQRQVTQVSYGLNRQLIANPIPRLRNSQSNISISYQNNKVEKNYQKSPKPTSQHTVKRSPSNQKLFLTINASNKRNQNIIISK